MTGWQFGIVVALQITVIFMLWKTMEVVNNVDYTPADTYNVLAQKLR